MSITRVPVVRGGPGGNRLRPDRYPERGPVYERVGEFGPDPERRDRAQRALTRRAVDVAVGRGELSAVLAAVLSQMMERSNDRLIGPSGYGGVACTGWWELATIRRMVPDGLVAQVDLDSEGGGDLEGGGAGEGGSARKRGGRTAGRWMAELGRLGWVERVHRRPGFVNGEAQWTSNLWRVQVPAHLRLELRGAQDAARARRGANRKGPGRAQPRGGSRPGGFDDSARRRAAEEKLFAENEARRRLPPCPACEGDRVVFDQDRRSSPCPFCRGAGYLSSGP